MKKDKTHWLLIALPIGLFVFFMICIIVGTGEETTVVPPTCTEKGYTIYEKNGRTQIKNILPPTEHKFNEWIVLREPDDIDCGIQERFCSVCGEKETQSIYNKSEIPRLSFEGDISEIGKTRPVNLCAEFYSDNIQFSGYASLKYQGHSSLKYDKKNFTVKFFSDEDCKQKNKFVFDGWNPEHKFILKATYIDTSRARNLICTDIWSQMVSTRADVHQRLLQTSNNGATDGFPVAVYLNDEFLGLYIFSLHKDDDLFGMEDEIKDGIAITNNGGTSEALFLQTVDWNNSADWEIEYHGTDDNKWIQEKLNKFIDFVINSSDEEFKTQLSQYADVDSLIDYMISVYSLGLTTSFSKDLILFTYDDEVWTASLFDAENAFGLLEGENAFASTEDGVPEYKDGAWYAGTESLLWNRFINAFYEQISERYANLREDILSEENIVKIAKKRIEEIPQNLNSADMELYPEQPMQDTLHFEQITKYASDRLALLDIIFDNTHKGE